MNEYIVITNHGKITVKSDPPVVDNGELTFRAGEELVAQFKPESYSAFSKVTEAARE